MLVIEVQKLRSVDIMAFFPKMINQDERNRNYPFVSLGKNRSEEEHLLNISAKTIK